MDYSTRCALSIRGSRVERGATVSMSEADAVRYGADLIALRDVEVVADEPVVETAVEDMSLAQLKEVAKARGLSTAGSKADLIERIQLAPEKKITSSEDSTHE